MFPDVNVMATNKSGPSPLAIVNRLKKLNFSDITMTGSEASKSL